MLDQHLERAFDVIAQMVCEPALESLAEEREIVLEEIAMYEDDPQDLIFDILGETIFPDHPLGRSTLGRAEVVGGADAREAARASTASATSRATIVIAAAGIVDHEQVVEWASAAFANGSSRQAARARPAPPAPTRRATRFRVARHRAVPPHARRTRDRARRRAALRPARARRDPRRHLLLAALPGGARAARPGLLRLQLPRASTPHTGQVGVYVGTRPENLVEVGEVLADELARIREEPVEPEELERAKDNVKGRVVLALESTAARMDRLGGSLLAGMPILALDETIERIEAVDADAVGALAAELFDPQRLSAAAIGPDEAAFRDAIAPRAGGARGDARDPRRRRRRRGAHGRRRRARRSRRADDLELAGRADPALGVALASILGGCDVVVDFTTARLGARQRARVRRGRRARRDRDDRLRRSPRSRA